MNIATFNIKVVCLIFYCTVSQIIHTFHMLHFMLHLTQLHTTIMKWYFNIRIKMMSPPPPHPNFPSFTVFLVRNLKKLLVKREFLFYFLFPPPTELDHFDVRKPKNKKKAGLICFFSCMKRDYLYYYLFYHLIHAL